MNTFQHFTRSFVEPVLTFVLFLCMVAATLWFINPKYFTHPSHYMKDVPNELYIQPVKEMPGCHERIKQYIMSAGELREQDLDPNVTIMMCGGLR